MLHIVQSIGLIEKQHNLNVQYIVCLHIIIISCVPLASKDIKINKILSF